MEIHCLLDTTATFTQLSETLPTVSRALRAVPTHIMQVDSEFWFLPPQHCPSLLSNPNLKAADTGMLDLQQLCGFLTRQETTLGDITSSPTPGVKPLPWH